MKSNFRDLVVWHAPLALRSLLRVGGLLIFHDINKSTFDVWWSFHWAVCVYHLFVSCPPRTISMAGNKGRIRSFKTSFKSIFGLMEIFGFPLDDPYTNSWESRLVSLFGFFFLLINWIINGIFAWVLVPRSFDYILMVAIFLGQDELEGIGRLELAHLAIFIVRIVMISLVPTIITFHLHLTGKWKDVIDGLMKIQNEMDLSAQFFRRCTNRCHLALCLLVLASYIWRGNYFKWTRLNK